MEKEKNLMNRAVHRRALLKNGLVAGGAVALGAGLLGGASSAFGDQDGRDAGHNLTRGDIAIVTFLSALEQV